MQINIEDRIVVITGPTTTGKSTLAAMIKATSPVKTTIISHDKIRMRIKQNQTEEEKMAEISSRLMASMFDALTNPEINLVIFDIPRIEEKYVSSLLAMIELINQYDDDITIIKTNIPLQIHCELMRSRIKSDPLVATFFHNFDEFYQAALKQRRYYESPLGSLNTNFYTRHQYVVSDPKTVTISYGFPEKLKINYSGIK